MKEQKILIPFIWMMALTLSVSPVQAASSFSADASSSLTVTGFDAGNGFVTLKPTGLGIGGFVDFFQLDFFAGPGATADATGLLSIDGLVDADLMAGEGVSQVVHAEGAISVPPTTALADALSDGRIDLVNATGGTVEVFFEFAWSWTVNSSADDPFLDGAEALADIVVFDDLNPQVPAIFETFGESDTAFGGGFDAASDTVLFSVLVPDGESRSIFVITDAFGNGFAAPALTAIPEPSTWVLLGTGLGGLLAVRWRQAA